jgi:CrcB protein
VNPFDPMVLLGIAGLGGVGSALRLLLSKWEGYLPWGVLTANILASFVAGFAAAYFSDDRLIALLVVGLAGGLSTFSSWAAAAVQMAAKDRKLAPVLYTLYTLILSSTAAYLGLLLG